MKKYFWIATRLYLAILIFASLTLFTNCSGGQPPEAVCNYGAIVCDAGSYLCDNFPQIPAEICTYFNLACLNLQVLCNSEPGSAEYETALDGLEKSNASIDAWLKLQIAQKE